MQQFSREAYKGKPEVRGDKKKDTTGMGSF